MQSPLLPQIVAPDHLKASRKIREALASYERSADLIQLGAYVSGSNPSLDQAIRSRDKVLGFLQQPSELRSPMNETMSKLAAIAGEMKV